MQEDVIYRKAAIDTLKRDEALVRAFGYQHAIEAIQALPSAESELKQKILAAGYEGTEVRFYIGGRLFAVRELAQ